MKAGIVVDSWKLPIFERRLRSAGFEWKNAGELTRGAITLTVETDDVSRLATVISEAQAEARSYRE